MTPNEFSILIAGYQRSRVVLTAMELDLFKSLSEAPRTASQLASAHGTHLRSTERLLDALVGMGVLTKTDGRYDLANDIRGCLTPGDDLYQGDMIRHHMRLWDVWSNLTEAVESGHPQAQFAEPETPEGEAGLRDFICAMSNIGRSSARSVVQAVDFSKDRRLLDVGGGPGTYALTIAAANPQLHATVFDFPAVLRITREQIALANLGDRVEVCPGDALHDEYGKDYDTVLMSNLIHAFGPDETRDAFARAFRALRPGGRVLVKEFVVDDTRTRPEFGALFSINMLVNTEKGDCYSEREMTQWLEEAGFRDISKVEVAMFSTILIGTRP